MVGPLNSWRARHGLPLDLALESLYRHLLLVGFPPGLQDPFTPAPATARRLQPLLFDASGDERLPERVASLPRPLVHATLGTLLDRADVLGAIVEGVRAAGASLVLTCGWGPASARLAGPFGSALGERVVVEPYIPHSKLLPYCDAVIAHGGAGTLAAALAHGLPLLLIPFFGDQPDNARRCAELGVARVIRPAQVTPEGIGAAVSDILTDPSYRRWAGTLQAEMAALPPVEVGLGWLEALGDGEAAYSTGR
jgi:UDP:flavonoid glycosyltransferase YjiC (YdhE family)